ncbi:MAG: hypothetical protein K6E59_04535 [Bacilli bacterium]|nr:hypothetical protein [Bacilli bacterium]
MKTPSGIIEGVKLFRLRDTPVENLTFIAMMVAFDAILSLVSALVPFSAIFLMLLAPLSAASISLFCKKRYIPLFLASALGICVAVTAWDFINTIFYLFPALLTGALYGLLWRLKLPSSLNIFLTSLLCFALFYGAIFLIQALLGGKDMIEVLLTLIRRNEDPYARDIFPLFILGYSIAQTAISHAFLITQLKRLGQEEASDEKLRIWYPAIGMTMLVAGFIIGFFHAKTGYFVFGLGLYWVVFALFGLAPKISPWTIVAILFSAFVGVLVFAMAYVQMPKPSGLLLLFAPLTLLCLACYLNRFLTLRQKEKKRHYE